MNSAKMTIRAKCVLDYILNIFIVIFPIEVILGLLMFWVKPIFLKIFLGYNFFGIMLSFIFFSVGIVKIEEKIISEIKKIPYIYSFGMKMITISEGDDKDFVNIIFFKKNYDGIKWLERSIIWKPKFFFRKLEDITKVLEKSFFEDGEQAIIIRLSKTEVNEKELRKNCLVNQNGDYYWL